MEEGERGGFDQIEAALEHRLGLGGKAGDQIGAEGDAGTQGSHAIAEGQRLAVGMAPLHALEHHVVAGLEAEMEMGHEARLVGDQIHQRVIDLGHVDRRQAQAGQLRHRDEQGADHAEPWVDAHTIASGIRVPSAIGDFLILRALRESGGFAIAVDDEAIVAAQAEVARTEGLLLCPEGAATYAAYGDACADGRVAAGETALLFNCATGLKYPMPPSVARIDCRAPIDWAGLRS